MSTENDTRTFGIKPLYSPAEIIRATAALLSSDQLKKPHLKELVAGIIEAGSVAVGEVVELEILPYGCTVSKADERDLKRVTAMGKAVFAGYVETIEGLDGEFILVPEGIPMSAELDSIIIKSPH